MQVSTAATEPTQGSSSEQDNAQPGSGRWFLASRRLSAARPVWCCVGAPSEWESPSARDGEKRGLAELSHSHGSPAPSSSSWLRPYPCSARRETGIVPGSRPEAPSSMGKISSCSPWLGLGKGVHNNTAALRAAEHSSPAAFNSSVPALPHYSAQITPSKLNSALELHKGPARGEEVLDVSPQQAFRVC